MPAITGGAARRRRTSRSFESALAASRRKSGSTRARGRVARAASRSDSGQAGRPVMSAVRRRQQQTRKPSCGPSPLDCLPAVGGLRSERRTAPTHSSDASPHRSLHARPAQPADLSGVKMRGRTVRASSQRCSERSRASLTSPRRAGTVEWRFRAEIARIDRKASRALARLSRDAATRADGTPRTPLDCPFERHCTHARFDCCRASRAH